MCHKLRTGFAVGIGIIAVQAVCLPIAVLPLPVLVNLVRRHIHQGADRRGESCALQEVDRSHHIRLISVNRILIGIPDNGLCCQVEYDLRLCLLKHLLHVSQIPHISCHAVHPL